MKAYFENLFLDSKEELCKIISKNIKKPEKMFIVTANAETFMYASNDKVMNEIITDMSNYIVADGISILKGAKKLKLSIPNKITGVELMEDMLQIANKNKSSIFLFGSTKKVLNALTKKINLQYSNINIVGSHEGYNYKNSDIFKIIKKKNPDMVFVALGIPRQERFIYQYLNKLNKGIFIGVGGSFDVISGCKKRAPQFFIKFNLEWLYRILREPKRIKRFYKNNVKFLLKLKK